MNWEHNSLGFDSGGWLVGPRPDEDAIAAAYLSMRADGTMKLISHQTAPDLRWWLTWMNEPDLLLIGAYRRQSTSTNLLLVGLGFVNRKEYVPGLVKAEVGFAFFGPDQPSIFIKADIVRAMVDYVFCRSDIECLVGMTPERNPAAAAMIRRVGFRQYGPIPNYCGWHGEPSGGFISQMDKQTWVNRRPHLAS